MKNSAGFSLGNIGKIKLAERKNKREKRASRAPRTPAGFSLGKIKNQGSPMKKTKGKAELLIR